MSRIKDLQKQVHRILKGMDDNQKRANAIAHLHGVSLTAVMIARKRGEDPELAAMAGLLHDMYAYHSGSYEDHAHRGAEYAREILKELEITTEQETEIIAIVPTLGLDVEAMSAGRHLRLKLQTEAMHFFDPETEESLL